MPTQSMATAMRKPASQCESQRRWRRAARDRSRAIENVSHGFDGRVMFMGAFLTVMPSLAVAIGTGPRSHHHNDVPCIFGASPSPASNSTQCPQGRQRSRRGPAAAFAGSEVRDHQVLSCSGGMRRILALQRHPVTTSLNLGRGGAGRGGLLTRRPAARAAGPLPEHPCLLNDVSLDERSA